MAGHWSAPTPRTRWSPIFASWQTPSWPASRWRWIRRHRAGTLAARRGFQRALRGAKAKLIFVRPRHAAETCVGTGPDDAARDAGDRVLDAEAADLLVHDAQVGVAPQDVRARESRKRQAIARREDADPADEVALGFGGALARDQEPRDGAAGQG